MEPLANPVIVLLIPAVICLAAQFVQVGHDDLLGGTSRQKRPKGSICGGFLFPILACF